MEADWEFEVGGGAPAIEAWWAGWIDLRRSPEYVDQLTEVAELPAMREALIRLNAADSPLWTSKCGVWTSDDGGQLDPDEFDASPGSTACVHGCYIDLLATDPRHWSSAEATAKACRLWIAALRGISARSCRADLVIRSAWMSREQTALAVTACLTGVGLTATAALAALEACLAHAAGVFCVESTLQ